jgi:hypothetical protein
MEHPLKSPAINTVAESSKKKLFVCKVCIKYCVTCCIYLFNYGEAEEAQGQVIFLCTSYILMH